MERKAGQAVMVPIPRGSRDGTAQCCVPFSRHAYAFFRLGNKFGLRLVFVKLTVLVWGSDKVVVLPHPECQLLSLEACFESKFILCMITNPKFHSGISAS